MKKVWIIEEFSAGEGKWNRFPFISDSRKKDAIEFMGHYLFQEQKKGRKPVCRVVGYPMPRKTVDVWVILAPYLRHGVTKATAATEEEGKRILHEYWKNGFGAYRMEKRRIKK